MIAVEAEVCISSATVLVSVSSGFFTIVKIDGREVDAYTVSVSSGFFKKYAEDNGMSVSKAARMFQCLLDSSYQ